MDSQEPKFLKRKQYALNVSINNKLLTTDILEKVTMEKINKKIIFYDRVLGVGIVSLLVLISSIFIIPDMYLDKLIFLIPWYISMIVLVACEAIITIGMIISAFKSKKYIWAIGILFLGTIFPIIYYLLIFKAQFEENK